MTTVAGHASAARSADIDMSVLIVEDDTLVGMGLRAHLESLNYRVVGQAASSDEAMALFRQHSPSAVLLDIRLGDEDGLDLAVDLLEERSCAIVIVSAYSDDELIRRATEGGAFGYLVKPVTRESLATQLSVALGRAGDLRQLREENLLLNRAAETRKLVQRAKAILMRRHRCDEPAAHRMLQVESQKRRINMGQLAQSIIDSDTG